MAASQRGRDPGAGEPAQDAHAGAQPTQHGRLPVLLADLRADPASGRLAIAALDAVGRAAFVVSPRGQLLLANQAAERLLASGQPFVLRAGRLTCRDGTCSRRLTEVLAVRARPSTFALDLAGSRWLISSVPLPEQGASLVIATDVRAHPVSSEGLRQFLGLSDAEAAVAVLLADGLSVKQIAFKRGVSVNTVRTQVREILRKAGVRRQQELSQLLAAIPRLGLPAD